MKDLHDVGVNFQILFNVKTPRHIHDDSDSFTHKRKKNRSWCEETVQDLINETAVPLL